METDRRKSHRHKRKQGQRYESAGTMMRWKRKCEKELVDSTLMEGSFCNVHYDS